MKTIHRNMLSALHTYTGYKGSSVSWLGQVPEHWEVERAKNLFTKVERSARDSDEVVTCFRDGMVTLRKNRRTEGFTESLKEIGYQGIRAGDLVIHAMDASAGAVGVSDSDGKGTPVYAVCEPKSGVNAYYHAFLIREMARSQWILALATGIRERSTDFRFGTFAMQQVPNPPLPEQNAIVRYLDYVERRVRRAVVAKRKLIELLEELKRGIIHHAVTRGLNPDAPLKNSGVEWLGNVPEQWDVRRLKTDVANVVKQTSVRSEEDLYIALEHVEGWTGRIFDSSPDMVFDSQVKRFRSGDVLFGKLRPYLAKVAKPESNGICVGEFLVLRPKSGEQTAAYLEKLLRSKSIIDVINASTFGAKMPRADWKFIGDLELPLPPVSEQIAIVEHLDKQTTKIDAAITRAQREIELLNEYRTRLIADVVTGQLDVRGAAAGLPAERESDDTTAS